MARLPKSIPASVDLPPAFGPALRMLRVEAGIGLRALADRIGVSCAYLSRVENGHDPAPTPDRLEAIARALDMPPSVLIDLAGRTGDALSTYVERVPEASALFLEIARRQLDASQLARVHAFIDEQFAPDPEPPALERGELWQHSSIRVREACRSVDALVELGAALCARGEPTLTAADIARRLRAKGSHALTALGHGVALPHALIEGAAPRAAVITLSPPLRLPTPDERPVDVVVFVISGSRDQHLEALAHIARLASRGAMDELRQASTPRRAASILRRLGMAPTGRVAQ